MSSPSTVESEPRRSALQYPCIQKVIHHDVEAGLLRFDGYFYHKRHPLPLDRIYLRNTGSKKLNGRYVTIHEEKIGPSTACCGFLQDDMKIERVRAAARRSQPFEDIVVDPPSADEIALVQKEEENRRKELGDKTDCWDDDYGNCWDDDYGMCFFPTNIIDIRYTIDK